MNSESLGALTLRLSKILSFEQDRLVITSEVTYDQ